MFFGAPWQFWAVILPGPGLLLVLRFATWAAGWFGWRRDPRPGFLDLTHTTARSRARKRPL